MITINLAPVEELENPYWWAPDAGVFVLILALALSGVKYYLSLSQDEIDVLTEETRVMTEDYAAMEAEMARHQSLSTKVKELEYMRATLTSITESKMTRYLPIILLEHIQNLKPEGVWLTGINFKTDDNDNQMAAAPPPPSPPAGDGEKLEEGAQAAAPAPAPALRSRVNHQEIEITGQAFDNVILAEFMTLLKATRNQDFDASDLRTQAFFDAIGLYFSDIKTLKKNEADTGVDVVNFKLGVTYQERRENAAVDMTVSRYLEDFRKRSL